MNRQEVLETLETLRDTVEKDIKFYESWQKRIDRELDNEKITPEMAVARYKRMSELKDARYAQLIRAIATSINEYKETIK